MYDEWVYPLFRKIRRLDLEELQLDFGGLEPEQAVKRRPDLKPDDPWCQQWFNADRPPEVWELAKTCRKAVLLERELQVRLTERTIRTGAFCPACMLLTPEATLACSIPLKPLSLWPDRSQRTGQAGVLCGRVHAEVQERAAGRLCL